MRICSLLPSGTEILFALGLGDRIIGVTDLCDYPPEVAGIRVVCRSRIDPAVMSSAEVDAEMSRILAAGRVLMRWMRNGCGRRRRMWC